MKKLLSIFATIGLASTTTIATIACSVPQTSMGIEFGGEAISAKNFEILGTNNSPAQIVALQIMEVLSFSKASFPNEETYKRNQEMIGIAEKFSIDNWKKSNLIGGLDEKIISEFYNEYNSTNDNSFYKISFEKLADSTPYTSSDVYGNFITMTSKTDKEEGTSSTYVVEDGKTLKELEDGYKGPDAEKKDNVNDFKKLIEEGFKDKKIFGQIDGVLPKKVVLTEDKDKNKDKELQKNTETANLYYVGDKDKQDLEYSNVALSIKPVNVIIGFSTKGFNYEIKIGVSGLTAIMSLIPINLVYSQSEKDKVKSTKSVWYWAPMQYQFTNKEIATLAGKESTKNRFVDFKIDIKTITKKAK